MVTQGSVLAIDLAAFSAQLLENREVSPRARIIAQAVAGLFPAAATNVYLLSTLDRGQVWVPQATAGEVSVHDSSVPVEQGTLGMIASKVRPFVVSTKELVREEYAHLNVRRTVNSLGYLPLTNQGHLLGAIEILSFETEMSNGALLALQPMAGVSAAALASAVEYEQERHSALSSISRLTQLYDLEKVFGSTLELDQLLPIIGSKFREVLECQAINVWLLQGDKESLVLMQQAGTDPTVHEGVTQKPGEGIAGDVSDNGEPVLIESPEDERLVQRNAGIEEGKIFSLMVAPLFDRGALVGVVEAINRLDRAAFDEDELFALGSLTETAAGALHNASLLMAERKVEILEALVKTSAEITSTLDLDRVLQAIVNGPAAVVGYERAAIALDQRGGIHLKAVSGSTQLNVDDPQYRGLREILKWGAILSEPLLITQQGEEIDSDREETRAKFREYFTETGMRACHLIPLADEEGRLGILLFESSDPDFLSEAHLEMLKVLASQATVALRNASLYKEVPFIGVLQPLIDRKKKFLALEKHRRAALIAAAVAVALFLAVFPLPMRVDGTAIVAPLRMAHLGADFEGIIKDVKVREGDVVKKGEVVASLEDWEYRSTLASARAKYQTAVAQMDRALANNDGSEAGMQRAQADYWSSEVARAQERLDRTLIRSPIDGVVATPQLENVIGRKLKVGESFVDIVDNSQALVDVSVTENDVSLLRSGEAASLKLDSFPERTFRGQVAVVSPQGVLQNDERVFFARVSVANPNGMLRSGMQGRGKVSTGWRAAGVVLFRRPGMWIWSKLWDWFGW
jgi:RND family efflux transporter MFP subunit